MNAIAPPATVKCTPVGNGPIIDGSASSLIVRCAVCASDLLRSENAQTVLEISFAVHVSKCFTVRAEKESTPILLLVKTFPMVKCHVKFALDALLQNFVSFAPCQHVIHALSVRTRRDATRISRNTQQRRSMPVLYVAKKRIRDVYNAEISTAHERGWAIPVASLAITTKATG